MTDYPETINGTVYLRTPLALADYTYRKRINLSNAGSELTDHQVKFTINRSSGSDSGFTVYVDSDCEADYDDIRFTSSDGTTLLSYWIESSSASTASIYVKIPTVAGTPSTTVIYLYYGYAAATAVSSGADTFAFFDNFADTDYTNDPTWTVISGTWSAATGQLVQSASGTSFRNINTPHAMTDAIIEANITARQYDGISFRIPNAGGGYVVRFGDSTSQIAITILGGSVLQYVSYSWTAGTEYKLGVKVHGTNIDVYVNDGYVGTWSDATYASGDKIGCLTHTTTTDTFDNIRVRSYAATEPTVSSWGSEESTTAGICTTDVGTVIEDTITVTPETPTVLRGSGVSCSASIVNSSPDIIISGSYNDVIAATIHNYTNVPSVITESIAIYDDMLSGKVSFNLGDKMYRAIFEYCGDKKANFDRIAFEIPDYASVSNTVFMGVIPSSSHTYDPDDDTSSLTGYDQAWYLTMQYLSDADKTLLSADEAATKHVWRLAFSNGVDWLHEGDLLHGDTSGTEGKILEIHGYYSGYVLLTDVTGSYVGSESLSVNGVNICYSDGVALDQGVDPLVLITPEEWVRRVLGGDNWNTTTGICPYRLIAVAGWAAMGKSFAWDETTTKMQAIEEVCKYLNYLFYVRWALVGGVMTPCAYFIPLSQIDTQLDLPATATIAKTDPYVAAPVLYEHKGDEQYTKIVVKCVGWDGKWYTSPRYYNDTWVEFAREYFEICSFADSQETCDARADALEAYYMTPMKKWTITVLDRSDLQMYQMVTFTGFGDEITSDACRIIGIEYVYSDDGTINDVTLTVIPETQFGGYISTARIFQGTIFETECIAQSIVDQAGSPETGTVVSVSVDGTVVTTTDRGITKLARDGSV